MKCLNELNLLPNPEINPDKMPYIQRKNNIYINLYEIILKKQINLYQYPLTISPKIEERNISIKEKLYKTEYQNLTNIYGDFFILGDYLYSMKIVDKSQTIKCALNLKGKNEYILELNKYDNQIIITQDNLQKDPLTKKLFEAIIKEILYANPRLESYKEFFVKTNDKENIEKENVSITFYHGFTINLFQADDRNFLNVTLKNKIIQNKTVLDYLIPKEIIVP